MDNDVPKDTSPKVEVAECPPPFDFDAPASVSPVISIRGRRPRRGRGRLRGRPSWKSTRASLAKQALLSGDSSLISSPSEVGENFLPAENPLTEDKKGSLDEKFELESKGLESSEHIMVSRGDKRKAEASATVSGTSRGSGFSSRRGSRRGSKGRGFKRKLESTEESYKVEEPASFSSEFDEAPQEKKPKTIGQSKGNSTKGQRKKSTRLTLEESKLEEIARLLDDTEPGWREEEYMLEDCDDPEKALDDKLMDDLSDDDDVDDDEEEEEEEEDEEEEAESESASFTQEEVDVVEIPRGRGTKRGRGRLSMVDRLSPVVGRRGRGKSRSLSPAVGKDSPRSESSGDSSIRGRPKGKQELPPSLLLSRGRGRGKGSNSETKQTFAGQRGKNANVAEKQVEDATASDHAANSPGQVKVAKKKKKHFRGLRYSFGRTTKKKRKNKSQAASDLNPDEASQAEEIEDDSLDSSSQDIPKNLLLPGELDPYDPTDEFDDSQVDKPLSLRQQRSASQRRSKEKTGNFEKDNFGDESNEDEEVVPALEEDNALAIEDEDEEESEDWNLLLEQVDDNEENEDDVTEATNDLVNAQYAEEDEEEEENGGGERYETIEENEDYEEIQEEENVPDQSEEYEREVEEESPEVFYAKENESDPVEVIEEVHLEEDLDDADVHEQTEAEEEPNPVEETEEQIDCNQDEKPSEGQVAGGELEQATDEENQETFVDEEDPSKNEADASPEVPESHSKEEDEDYDPKDDNYDPKDDEDNYDPKDDEYNYDPKDDEDTYESESTTDNYQETKENDDADLDSLGSEEEIKRKKSKRNKLIMSYPSTKRRRSKAQKKGSSRSIIAARKKQSLEKENASAKMEQNAEIKSEITDEMGSVKESDAAAEITGDKGSKELDPNDDANQSDGVRKSKRLSRLGGSAAPLAIAAPHPPLEQDSEVDASVDFYKSEVADKSITNVLCKCRVKENPRAVNLSGDIYCQAIDSFDGRMIGCCNIVTNHRYLRVSGKIPFMLLCTIHRQRIRRHNCCPGCGLFCTQGTFLECRWDKLGPRHYYHKLCGLIVNESTLCPHCGTDQPPIEVYLELKLTRKPVVYLKQHQEKKGFLSSARISLTKITDPEPPPPDPAIQDGSALALPNGKNITPTTLPVGFNKPMLVEAIKAINAGKTFNIKPAPKAIYWSCKQGDLEKLLHVLAQGLSPNSRVKEYGNQSGLHTAANYGCLEAIHVLVLAGASLDLTDTQLMTPLMVAITKGFDDITNYLVQAGASLHAKTQDGMTCLHLAAKSGNYTACKYILDSGRLTRHAINIQDEGGWTPLVWASENRCINVVKILLDRGANPQICDVEQNTALHWAAFSGSTHICSMVLDHGCSLRSMNAIGDTPLHIAARQNHVEAVVLLLARGASLEMKNTRGQTPMECTFPDTEVHLQMTLNKKLHNVLSDHGVKSEKILSSDIAAGKEAVPIPCVNGEDVETLPKDYIYLSENCEAFNVNIDRTLSSLKWCECEDGCNSENCICSQLNFQCWYDPEGRLLADFNYRDPPMIFECNRACGCNKLSCHNRVVQHGMTAHLQLFRTFGKGWGVRALKDIPKGSYVCEYVGEIITDLEADQREDDSYLFDLDNRDSETYCIDARQYGNIARFINHLCEPNLTPVKVFIDHQDLLFPRIAFFANRDIEADQELGFDYGEKFWVIKYKHFTCMCASPICKYSSETIHATLENYNRRMKEFQQREKDLKLLVT